MTGIGTERGGVVLDGVHLLELGHVRGAEATRLASGFGDFAAGDLLLFLLLLASREKICLNFRGIDAQLIHHPLGIGAQAHVDIWTRHGEGKGSRGNAELRGRRVVVGGSLSAGNISGFDVSESKPGAGRVRSGGLGLAGMHLRHGRLDGRRRGRGRGRVGRGDGGLEAMRRGLLGRLIAFIVFSKRGEA